MRDCRCDDAAIARYRRRLSGPLLDRIDLQVALRPVAWDELDGGRAGPTSAALGPQIAACRERAEARGIACNAQLPDRALESMASPSPEAQRLLGRAVEGMGLSARAARRALRVARTCADLADETTISAPAMAEALSYQLPDSGEGTGLG